MQPQPVHEPAGHADVPGSQTGHQPVAAVGDAEVVQHREHLPGHGAGAAAPQPSGQHPFLLGPVEVAVAEQLGVHLRIVEIQEVGHLLGGQAVRGGHRHQGRPAVRGHHRLAHRR